MTEKYKIPIQNNIVQKLQDVLSQNQDIRDGKKQLLMNRDKYFVKLEGQSDDDFEAMIKMAPHYILYPKIVDGFTGVVFAKKPILKGIKLKDKTSIENVDMLGNSLVRLSQNIVTNVIENGFCATLNDYSDKAGRSFIKSINPSQFVSYRTSNDKGFPEITQFIYREERDSQNEEDEFDTIVETYYIVLDMAEKEGSDGLYFRSRTFKSDGNKQNIENNTSNNKNVAKDAYSEMTLLKESFPMMNNAMFKYIPIQLHGVDTSDFLIKKSALQDLSDMNISVIQRVIDQVHMLHWTALPTPWGTGIKAKEEPKSIGPTTMMISSNPEAKFGMLEFSGSSAKAHQDFVDNLKEIMAATGAQILKKEGVSRETATSVLVRTAAQTSLIATLVENVSKQIQSTAKIHFEWNGDKLDEEFSYQLNKDFLKVDIEPNALNALLKSWMDGAISHKTLFEKMKEGEIIPTERTFQEELDNISVNKPPFWIANMKEEESDKGSNLENGNLSNRQATEQV